MKLPTPLGHTHRSDARSDLDLWDDGRPSAPLRDRLQAHRERQKKAIIARTKRPAAAPADPPEE